MLRLTRSRSRFIEALETRRLFSAVDAGIDGVGVLGDSYSDEYQFYPPDRSTAANWVEQLADDSNADFGAFFPDDPPGARNAGHAYNWAVSGATSSSMIADGQLAGVVGQVASGEVDLVTCFIGGNDFRDVLARLLIDDPITVAGMIPGTAATLVTNIATATGTMLSQPVLAANPDARLILTTIPKLSHLPQVKQLLLAIPALAPLVGGIDAAVEAVNGHIKVIAAATGGLAAVADFAALADDWMAAETLKVGNVEMERAALFNPTNDPTHLVLADGLHSGTIAQGLLANLYVQTANGAFGTAIKPLSSHEILVNAGLKPALPDAATPPAPATSRPSPFAGGSPIGGGGGGSGGRLVHDELLGLVA